MAIDYAAEIVAIEEAIASGVTKVAYNGKSVEYASLDDLFARRRWLQAQVNPNGSVRPTAALARFNRGDC